MLGGPNDRQDLKRYAVLIQVGLEIAAPPAVGALIDRSLNSSPWGAAIGAALGLTVGLIHLVRMSNQEEQPKTKEDKDGPEHGEPGAT